jgi:hypothetical protein
MRPEMTALSGDEKGDRGASQLQVVAMGVVPVYAVKDTTEPLLAKRAQSRANYPETAGSSMHKPDLRPERGSKPALRRRRADLDSLPSLRVRGFQGRRDELLRTLL